MEQKDFARIVGFVLCVISGFIAGFFGGMICVLAVVVGEMGVFLLTIK